MYITFNEPKNTQKNTHRNGSFQLDISENSFRKKVEKTSHIARKTLFQTKKMFQNTLLSNLSSFFQSKNCTVFSTGNEKSLIIRTGPKNNQTYYPLTAKLNSTFIRFNRKHYIRNNFHSLRHFCDQMRSVGCFASRSAFAFESVNHNLLSALSETVKRPETFAQQFLKNKYVLQKISEDHQQIFQKSDKKKTFFQAHKNFGRMYNSLWAKLCRKL